MSGRAFFKNWWRPEVAPLVGIIGFAVTGATWYVTHLARGPHVVWQPKSNPYPWLQVEEDAKLKLYTPSRQEN
jgi:NADH dehydrogenase (ubiquinone) 1 alpha subcomplex subunit 4